MDFGFEIESGFETLEPGHADTASLVFWASEDLPEISVDQGFELREGQRIIGRGQVIEVVGE